MEVVLNNLSDTKLLAKKLANKLIPGQIVALYGDLGSGKTTLIQMIAKELGIEVPVTSPTFVIQKNYPLCHPELTQQSHPELAEGSGSLNKYELIHIDCYRLNNLDDTRGLGFEELFADKNNLILIEWADKIESILPENTIRIKLTELDDNKRQVEIDKLPS